VKEEITVKNSTFKLCILVAASLTLAGSMAEACTRILYKSQSGDVLIGRSMDWYDNTETDLWAFPAGMARDGGVSRNPITWTSKYGSVVASIYDRASVDGMNSAGLVANMLYLAEADYGDWRISEKPVLSLGGWLQYILDNYRTVDEAVTELRKEPFVIAAPGLPGGKPASAHVSIGDASGDSAVFEYIDGKLQIHHGEEYTVMTNSPPFDQQIAIETYWREIDGLHFLPGTHTAADRFVRIKWNLENSPSFKSGRPAYSSVFSLMRFISVPFGISDPAKPNIATTQWRTVADIERMRYGYDSVFNPAVFYVALDKLDLSETGQVMRLDMQDFPEMSGEVSAGFEPHAPFPFLSFENNGG